MIKHTMPPATYRPLDVSAGVRANAQRFPNKVAVRLGKQTLSYGQLGMRINQVSHLAINYAGLAAGENAALIAGNVVEYFEIVCGISATGAAVATINPRQQPAELAAVLADCQARLIFVDQANEEVVRSVKLPDDAKLIVIGVEYEALLAQSCKNDLDNGPQEWETFAIPYTSGTTGKPKGVCLSHRSRVIGFFAHASVYGCFSTTDSFLVTTPLFHGGGFAFPMGTLYLGGEVELMPPFQPDVLLDLLSYGRHSGTFVVPTQLNAMLSLENTRLDKLRDHRLTSVICNAAPLAEDTKLRILDYLGEGVLHETYGSTEAGVVTNLTPADMRRKQNCVGPPIACQTIRLLNDERQPIASGEIGELFVNGPTLFNGYFNREEETAACFHEGWFSAGDLVRIDDEGYVYIVDRRKDMIISGGVNIYPRDIEETLFSHPEISDAAVIGVLDEHWGEAVAAFVVKTPDSNVNEQSIMDFCKQNLASFKVPKAVKFIDAVPRNAAGKVLRKELRPQVK